MYDDLVAGINADNLLINYQILQINKQILKNSQQRDEEIIKLLKEIRDNGIKRNI